MNIVAGLIGFLVGAVTGFTLAALCAAMKRSCPDDQGHEDGNDNNENREES